MMVNSPERLSCCTSADTPTHAANPQSMRSACALWRVMMFVWSEAPAFELTGVSDLCEEWRRGYTSVGGRTASSAKETLGASLFCTSKLISDAQSIEWAEEKRGLRGSSRSECIFQDDPFSSSFC